MSSTINISNSIGDRTCGKVTEAGINREVQTIWTIKSWVKKRMKRNAEDVKENEEQVEKEERGGAGEEGVGE